MKNFVIYIIFPIGLSSIFGAVHYYNKTQEEFQNYDSLQKFMSFCLYGFWTLFNTFRFFNMPASCKTYAFSTTMWCYELVIVIGAPFGLALGCCMTCILCYMPYFFYQCYMRHREDTADVREKQSMLSNLVSVSYDASLFS